MQLDRNDRFVDLELIETASIKATLVAIVKISLCKVSLYRNDG